MAPLEGSEQLGRQLTAHEPADLIVSADSSTRAATSDQRNRARSRLMAALIPSMSWSSHNIRGLGDCRGYEDMRGHPRRRRLPGASRGAPDERWGKAGGNAPRSGWVGRCR